MTNLSIKNLGFAVGAMFLTLGLAFAAATPAFASVNQNNLLINGKTSDSVELGSTYEGKLFFTNTGNSTVQSVWIEILNSGFEGECKDVSDQNTTGPHTVLFTGDTLGATEGSNHDIRITTFGAVPPQANNNCDTSIGTSNAHTFYNQLTITEDQNEGDTTANTGSGGGNASSGGNTGSSDNGIPAWFTDWLNGGFKTVIESLLPKPLCAEFKTLMVGQSYGSHSAGALQTFLITKGGQSGVITYGATGYYGPQTSQAVTNFQLANSCN